MPAPAAYPRWSTNGGTTTTPSSGAQDTGFVPGTAAAGKIVNWLINLIYQWIVWFDTQDIANTVAHNNYDAAAITLGTVRAKNWDLRSPGAYTDDFRGVAHGLINSTKTWVAVGLDKIMYSVNGGRTWLAGTGAPTGTFRGVAYGNGVFVAVGGTGTTRTIYSSTDGKAWTSRSAGGSGAGFLTAVIYGGTTSGGNIFCAVGQNGEIQTSTNGTTWTQRTPANAADDLNGVVMVAGTIVAIGGNGSGRGVAETSSDGTTWTQHLFPVAAGNALALTNNGSEILAVGVDASVSTTGVVYTSTNSGATWTLAKSFTNYVPFGVTYVGGQYIACSDSSTDTSFGQHPALLIAPLSITATWTITHGPSGQESVLGNVGGTLWAIANDGERFVTVGSYGTLATSHALA